MLSAAVDNKTGVMILMWRCILGVCDPRVLIAVGPKVAEEPVDCRGALVASPGQGEDVLRRRLDGYDGNPGGAYRAGGGFGHHGDGGAIPDGAPVGVQRNRRGGGRFQDGRVEPAELAAHELETFEGAWSERARVHQERLTAQLAQRHDLPKCELAPWT